MKIFYHFINGLFLLAYWLLIASITLRILMKRRSASATITWLLMIYILPLVGIIAYLLFGELHLGRRKAERAQAIGPSMAEWFSQLRKCGTLVTQSISPAALPLFRLCEQRQKIPPLCGNQLTLQTTPQAIFHALMQDIKAAHHCIDVVFYIWQDGGLVDQVAEVLMKAARRGVRCRLLLDAAGSAHFWHSHYPTLMRAAGIQLVKALPVNPLRIALQRIDLRQHRKMVLIDHHIAYTGSMNMADPRFFQLAAPIGYWIDLMVRIEGPTALVLGSIFAWDWEVETGERLLPPLPLNNAFSCTPLPETAVQVVASGPGFPEEMIHQTLLTAIYSARSRLIMTTPYFVPSDDLLCAITLAAQRGVHVELIVPKQNHSLLVKWASRSFFEPLLAAGIHLYQYEQGFLHTKSILIDDHLSLIGTVNLDMRSLWLNFEITIVVDDATFGAELADVQQSYRAHSSAIEAATWAKRPLQQRIAERIFYFFSPLL